MLVLRRFCVRTQFLFVPLHRQKRKKQYLRITTASAAWQRDHKGWFSDYRQTIKKKGKNYDYHDICFSNSNRVSRSFSSSYYYGQNGSLMRDLEKAEISFIWYKQKRDDAGVSGFVPFLVVWAPVSCSAGAVKCRAVWCIACCPVLFIEQPYGLWLAE